MSEHEILVSDGPDKADLLRAVTNPEAHLHVTFRTPTELVEAHLEAIQEITTDGMTFGLKGPLASGKLCGPHPKPQGEIFSPVMCLANAWLFSQPEDPIYGCPSSALGRSRLPQRNTTARC